VLGGLRRNGTVAYEMLHARAIDWTTIRVIGEHAPKKKARAQRPPKAAPIEQPSTPAPEPAPVAAAEAATALEDCISVTYDASTAIATLEGRERALRTMADEIAAELAVLRQQPKLGPKGARAMQLIAEIMKGD